MVRLLAISDNAARWQAVESRLANVAIKCRPDLLADFSSFDAIAIVDGKAIDRTAIEQCLRHGKQVLYATNLNLACDELTAIQQIANEHQGRFVVANPDRFLPSRQLIRQQIPSQIGRAGLVRIHRWMTSMMPGVLLRDLDLALWLADSKPNTVFAIENHTDEKHSLHVHLGFPGGGMALIDQTNALPNGEDYQALSVIGSIGAAYADELQNCQLLFRGGRPDAIRVDEGIHQAVDMVKWFLSDSPDGVAGWEPVFAAADAVRQSLKTRQAVVIEGE